LFRSFNVIVIVELAIPSATTGDDPEIVEFAATAAPAVNVTVPPDFATGEMRLRVLISAVMDASVQVDTPFESLVEQVP
jgi:hypothetical protein